MILTSRKPIVDRIPVFIIAYNQYTFVKDMVEQLQKYINSDRIHILDNKSTYPPMIEYLKSIEGNVHVHRFHENYGHSIIEVLENLNYKRYIITDPDIAFNKNLPKNFINILDDIAEKYKSGRVGFALDISNNICLDILYCGQTVIEWESQFWTNRIPHRSYELYKADIDTTFCLINKEYEGDSIRIAGDFTCVHRPWVIGWKNSIPSEEIEFYKQNNISTSWI